MPLAGYRGSGDLISINPNRLLAACGFSRVNRNGARDRILKSQLRLNGRALFRPSAFFPPTARIPLNHFPCTRATSIPDHTPTGPRQSSFMLATHAIRRLAVIAPSV